MNQKKRETLSTLEPWVSQFISRVMWIRWFFKQEIGQIDEVYNKLFDYGNIEKEL